MTPAQRKRWFDFQSAYGCVVCRRAAQIHHVRNHTGMGKRPVDECTVPLCDAHHDDLHDVEGSTAAWEKKWGVSLAERNAFLWRWFNA